MSDPSIATLRSTNKSVRISVAKREVPFTQGLSTGSLMFANLGRNDQKKASLEINRHDYVSSSLELWQTRKGGPFMSTDVPWRVGWPGRRTAK